MIAPTAVYSTDRTDPLSDLRTLASRYPEAMYGDSRELARLLRCSEPEADEARRWLIEDGLEVRA
jgi:hypothetical protein